MLNESSTVIEHADCGPGYRRLVLSAPRVAATAAPGQFVHVRVPGLEASALRRPFSIFDAGSGRLELLYKVVGRGTGALVAVVPGAAVEVLGPLGKGFPTECRGVPLLVGGGYGVAPLHFLAKTLTRNNRTTESSNGRVADETHSPHSTIRLFDYSIIPPRLFVGGRTKDDLLALDRFAALGVEVSAATDDGSFGTKGFAVVPLDAAIAELRGRGTPFELFACGPDGLLKAVAARALDAGMPGWISCDRHMVCGVGACYACIQKTTHGNSRCCLDGPVFSAAELVF